MLGLIKGACLNSYESILLELKDESCIFKISINSFYSFDFQIFFSENINEEIIFGINRELIKIKFSIENELIKNKYTYTKAENCLKISKDVQPLGFKELVGAFILYLSLFFLSLIYYYIKIKLDKNIKTRTNFSNKKNLVNQKHDLNLHLKINKIVSTAQCKMKQLFNDTKISLIERNNINQSFMNFFKENSSIFDD